MPKPHSTTGAIALIAGITLLGVNAKQACSQATSGLPLPPGQIITGPVYWGQPFSGLQCPPGSGTSCIGNAYSPSITTGVNANAYLFAKYSDPSFTPSGPAVVVQTTAPTQYVRFYLPFELAVLSRECAFGSVAAPPVDAQNPPDNVPDIILAWRASKIPSGGFWTEAELHAAVMRKIGLNVQADVHRHEMNVAPGPLQRMRRGKSGRAA